MRTLLFVVGGFVLLAVFVGGAKVLGNNGGGSLRLALIAFCVIWFVIAAGNLWIGVSSAGYSFIEELPIFLLIFGVPALAALVVRWKWA
jgi:hypothetical protein